jgi:Icc-related predicted phosphoesterase
MRIMSMSNVYGDFETLQKALDYIGKTDAKVITIQGDLSGKVLDGDLSGRTLDDKDERNKMFALNNLIGKVHYQMCQRTQEQMTYHDCAHRLTEPNQNFEASEDLKKAASIYLSLEEKAKKGMSENYRKFKEMFEGLPQKVLLVPGDWDGIHIDDFLAKQNIHDKYPEEIDGIKFVGYGGSPEPVPELPFDLTFGFIEDEAFSHFSKNKGEVVLSHTIPRGYGNNGYRGHYSLLAYIYRCAPSLFLMGHNNHLFVSKESETGTILANPGNLGKDPLPRNSSFGTFLEFEIDENKFVTPIAVHKVSGNEIETGEIKQKVPQ